MKKSHANIVLLAYDRIPATPHRGVQRPDPGQGDAGSTPSPPTRYVEPDQYASNGRLTRAKIIDP